MPVRNEALKTGMKPSSSHPDTYQCPLVMMLKSCFPAGAFSTLTTLSVSTARGGLSCTAFPFAPVKKEMAQGLQCIIRGRSPEPGREDEERACSKANMAARPFLVSETS